MKNTHWAVLPVSALLILFMLLANAASADPSRPSNWAAPIVLEGVGNLHRINDTLYRSEQPTDAGMKNLKEKLGIKTIINLRAFHSDASAAAKNGLLNEELSVKTWHIEDEDVVRVLRILKQKENGPFLIHCQHGADRTGVMSAMYRIVEQGWSKQDAINEMVNGGYGFHPVWSNIIDYLNNVDIISIKNQLNETPH